MTISDSHEQEFCVDQGSMINQACFSGNGNLRFLWTSGESANYAYIYDVSIRPATLDSGGGEAVYEKVTHPY